MIWLYILGYLLIGLIVSFLAGKYCVEDYDNINFATLGVCFFLWPLLIIFFLVIISGMLIYRLIIWGKE